MLLLSKTGLEFFFTFFLRGSGNLTRADMNYPAEAWDLEILSESAPMKNTLVLCV